MTTMVTVVDNQPLHASVQDRPAGAVPHPQTAVTVRATLSATLDLPRRSTAVNDRALS